MKAACVIGHFGAGKNFLDGQTIKTKIITTELQNQLGAEHVAKYDTHGGWKVLMKADYYLLDEYLAEYRKGRKGSVSTHSVKTMIRWHYRLYREAEKQNAIVSFFNTGRNLLFGLYKKISCVTRN